MFDPDLLKRVHCAWLASRRAGRPTLVTEPRSWLRGGEAETVELREYAPGDDYRCVDWMLCARRDELLTRVPRLGEDFHLYVLLDCSASMGLGNPAKFHLARRVAAAVGYVALSSLCCLGVTAFCGGIVADLPPARHKGRLPGLLRFLERLTLQTGPTDLQRAAERFASRYQRHGPTIVISDLCDRRGFQHGLDVLRHRGYEPRVVQIYDAREAEPQLLGDVELVDVETQAARPVTLTERSLRRYRELFAWFQGSVREYCARHALVWQQIANTAPEEDVLWSVLGGGPSV